MYYILWANYNHLTNCYFCFQKARPVDVFETAIGLGLSSAAEIADSIKNFGYKDSASGAFEFLGAKSEFSRDVILGQQNSDSSDGEDDDDNNDQRKKRSPSKSTEPTVTPDKSRKKRQVPAIDTENVVPGGSQNPGVGEKDPNIFKRIVDAIVDASNRMISWVQDVGSKKIAQKGQQ